MTDSVSRIRAGLLDLQDPTYKVFQAKLMPTINPDRIIGVRTPDLRKYAKLLAGSADAEAFLRDLPHAYYDENNLHAALLEKVKDFDTALTAVEAFLPYIDNWATCDGFCPKILRSSPDVLWERILVWLSSPHTYTVRYGLVRLTAWFLDDPLFSDAVLQAAANVRHPDYYVRMAQSWLFSIALIKQYDTALPYLTEHRLPLWIHNKAIQKAVESHCFSTNSKQFLKTLKRTAKT